MLPFPVFSQANLHPAPCRGAGRDGTQACVPRARGAPSGGAAAVGAGRARRSGLRRALRVCGRARCPRGFSPPPFPRAPGRCAPAASAGPGLGRRFGSGSGRAGRGSSPGSFEIKLLGIGLPPGFVCRVWTLGVCFRLPSPPRTDPGALGAACGRGAERGSASPPLPPRSVPPSPRPRTAARAAPHSPRRQRLRHLARPPRSRLTVRRGQPPGPWLLSRNEDAPALRAPGDVRGNVLGPGAEGQ